MSQEQRAKLKIAKLFPTFIQLVFHFRKAISLRGGEAVESISIFFFF